MVNLPVVAVVATGGTGPLSGSRLGVGRRTFLVVVVVADLVVRGVETLDVAGFLGTRENYMGPAEENGKSRSMFFTIR